MFYIFQLGTDMLTFTTLYFIELIFLFTTKGIGVGFVETEKIFLFSFPLLLFCALTVKIISKCKRYKNMETQNIFHPTTTFRQRFAEKMFFVLFILSFTVSFLLFFIDGFARILFIIINSISIFSILLSFIFSLFFESLPDKNDTIRFEDEKMYYYMRVKKDSKNNKYMNSYIIPYEAIVRSYIVKNNLYIEFDRAHPELQIRREFSTKSKRLVISLLEYPELKTFLNKRKNRSMINMKKIENIELSDFQWFCLKPIDKKQKIFYNITKATFASNEIICKGVHKIDYYKNQCKKDWRSWIS